MSDDVVTIPSAEGPYRVPKSIVDAISDIQQYTVMESEGITDIPEGYLTLRRTLAYVNIGFKYGLGDNVLVWVLSPFLYGVLFNKFSIFGHTTLSLFDKVYTFILSKYITIGLLTLMIYILFKAKGNISKGCSFSLVSGYSLALLIRTIVFLFVYRFAYANWPKICKAIYNTGDSIVKFLPGPGNYLMILAYKMTDLRDILLITSNYETVFSFIMLIIISLLLAFMKFFNKRSSNPYFGRFGTT